jgi:hypothetical protein
MTDLQSDTRKRHRTRANNLCLAIFGTVFLLILLAPFLSTVWWHMRHGNHARSNGIRVPVPWPWQAHTKGGVIYLQKWPVILSVHAPLLASVALAPIQDPPETEEQKQQFDEAFANLYRTKLAPSRDAVEGPIRIGVRGDEGICMQSVPTNSKDWLHTTCLIFRGTWSADFQGNAKDRKTVFGQILGLPEPTSQRGPAAP